MYTQALNTSEGEDRHVEDAARSAQFQARIDADDRIEPNDWMPAAYRKTLTRPKATGSPARRRCAARPRCSRKCRTNAAMGSISMPPPRRSAPPAKNSSI
jgi:hypothetical protein